MPELPEVEIVKRGLNRMIESEQPRIQTIVWNRPDIRWPLPTESLRRLDGALLENVARRAKFLIFTTDRGSFISHLGMTGNWRLEGRSFEEQKHDHLALIFENGTRLIYQDPRRFGFIVMENSKRWRAQLAALGPEPLDDEFTPDLLWKKSRGKTVPLKNFIMDQQTVVGVGNIYASEALFLAGLRPARRAGRVSRAEFEKLVPAIRQVLLQSIEAGGSTISDFRNVEQNSGYFQNQFRVYGREGLPCPTCRTPVKARAFGGRTGFWCPRCQS